MKRNWFTFALVPILSLFLFASCGADAGAGKRYPDYRYRLTVEVDTPEGLKTGSSVIEVSTQKAGKYAIPNAGWVSSKVKGEAVTVDLGKRGTMFALLRSGYYVDWAAGALQSVAEPLTYEETKAARRAGRDPFDIRMQRTLALTGKHDLPRYVDNYDTRRMVERGEERPSAYPMLVTFKDMSDPKSVVKLDSEDLTAAFGEGVKMRRIIVERTNDRVTNKIVSRLTWLRTHKGSLVKYPNNTPIANQLFVHRVTQGDFVKELNNE